MKIVNEKKVYVGIDPGISTGIAVRTMHGEFLKICTVEPGAAFIMLLQLRKQFKEMYVCVQDARKGDRRYFIKKETKAKGEGYMKGYAEIWENYLAVLKIPYLMKSPQDNPFKGDVHDHYNKETRRAFNEAFSYRGNTSSQGRDAAYMIFGFSDKPEKHFHKFEKEQKQKQLFQ